MSSSRRSAHTEPAPPSTSSLSHHLPTDSTTGNAAGARSDLNNIHLDMFFKRALKPLSSSPPSNAALVPRAIPTVEMERFVEPVYTEENAERDSVVDKGEKAEPEYHLFDTYEQIIQLQAWGGFSQDQAKAIIQVLQQRLRQRVIAEKKTLLASSQLENESYLIGAAVSELQREVQLLRKNDHALLQSELTALAREVESLAQRLSEDLGNMRDEIELSMNDYRGEVREEQKSTEYQIREVNNRLTIILGDAATELESLKWGIIWRGLLGGVMAAMSISLLGYLLSLNKERVASERRRIDSKAATDERMTYADMELC